MFYFGIFWYKVCVLYKKCSLFNELIYIGEIIDPQCLKNIFLSTPLQRHYTQEDGTMFLFLSRDLKEKERHTSRGIYVPVLTATRHSKGVARASVSDFNRSVVRGWTWHATGGIRVLYILLGICRCSSSSEVLGVEKHIRALPPWYVPDVPIFALFLIKDDMHLQFNELAKKHDSMFSVHLDTRRFQW